MSRDCWKVVEITKCIVAYCRRDFLVGWLSLTVLGLVLGLVHGTKCLGVAGNVETDERCD